MAGSRMTSWAGALAGIVLAGIASADLWDFNGSPLSVEYVAGEGENAAALVLNFGSAWYAFGYQWSGSVSGLDMISGVAAAGGVDITTQDFGFGLYVESIRYDGLEMGAGGWPNDWLSYWTSTDGASWSVSMDGAGARMLTNGDWDGWSQETSDVWPPVNTPPVVPEPASAALLAVGAGVLLLRRRGKSGVRADAPRS